MPLLLYGAILGGLWFFQERILFPAYIVPAAGPLPAGASRLSLDAGDGVRLEGVHIPASAPRPGAALALVFAGNASNAQGVAEQLHDALARSAISSPSSTAAMRRAPASPRRGRWPRMRR